MTTQKRASLAAVCLASVVGLMLTVNTGIAGPIEDLKDKKVEMKQKEAEMKLKEAELNKKEDEMKLKEAEFKKDHSKAEDLKQRHEDDGRKNS